MVNGCLKFRFVKTARLLVAALLLMTFFSSCKEKPESEPVKSSAKEMSNVTVIAGGQVFFADLEGTTFGFLVSLQLVEKNPDAFKNAMVNFKVSDGAVSKPKSGDWVDLTDDVSYTVTAEDGSTAEYIVRKIDGSSSEANIEEFILFVGNEELVGDINESASKITLTPTHKMWGDLTTATPVFKLSFGASSEPKSDKPQDFTQPFEYIVTAHDGTIRKWTVEALDPCILETIPGCYGYHDTEPPALGNTITLGTLANPTNHAVSGMYMEKIDDGFWLMRCSVAHATRPLVMHTVRFTTDYYNQYSVETWVARDSISGKESPGAMVTRYGNAGREVRLATNGGFYNTATGGTPITMQKTNGILTYLPSGNLPIIGFDARNRPYMDSVKLNSKMKIEKNGKEWVINSVNGIRSTDFLVVYNSYKGRRTGTNQWGIEALCTPVDGDWEVLDNHINVRCRVERVATQGNMEIPKGKIVLSGVGPAHNQYLNTLQTGDYVTVTVDYFLKSYPDITSTTIRNIVSGWNIILNNNVIMPYFNNLDALESGNNPRTGVGFTNDKKHVFFTVVEGRHAGVSMGVNTQELARIMQYFGAENAVNLDGGGSSCMIVDKNLVNRIEGVYTYQRPVADGLAIIRK